jgi:hypothetical protein
VRRADNLTTFMCRPSLKSGSLNLLEPSGPVKACNGIALPVFTNVAVAEPLCIIYVFVVYLTAQSETSTGFVRPHTRTVLPSVLTAQAKLCQVCFGLEDTTYTAVQCELRS